MQIEKLLASAEGENDEFCNANQILQALHNWTNDQEERFLQFFDLIGKVVPVDQLEDDVVRRIIVEKNLLRFDFSREFYNNFLHRSFLKRTDHLITLSTHATADVDCIVVESDEDNGRSINPSPNRKAEGEDDGEDGNEATEKMKRKKPPPSKPKTKNSADHLSVKRSRYLPHINDVIAPSAAKELLPTASVPSCTAYFLAYDGVRKTREIWSYDIVVRFKAPTSERRL